MCQPLPGLDTSLHSQRCGTTVSTLSIRGHEVRGRAVITSHTVSQSLLKPALLAVTYIEYMRRRGERVGAHGGTWLPDPAVAHPGVDLEAPRAFLRLRRA